jgi:hypothetical protein
LTKFAFHKWVSLCRYATARSVRRAMQGKSLDGRALKLEVGLYTLHSFS